MSITGPPDSWIERHWLDEPVEPSKPDTVQCVKCGKLRDADDCDHDDVCLFCLGEKREPLSVRDVERMAAHQLTFPGNGAKPRVCFCGQLLFDCAIKCSSREECHAENVSRAALIETSSREIVGITAVLKQLRERFT